MAAEINSIVIIGAGQAAAQAIASLRQGGYQGAITLIGEETALPYQRPPLSKAYMKGELEESRLYFRPAAWYEQNDIEVMLGQRAQSIDRTSKTVSVENGATVKYDRLLVATGARARVLPVDGADLDHIYDLRTLVDVERIRPQMVGGRRIVIIGAGYIGLEAAAVAHHLDLDVTVIEAADRVLARVTSPTISEFYQGVHKDAGVKIHCGVGLSSFRGVDGALAAAVLDNGEEIEADIALVGIGILPNEELAREAGIACDNGIVVDRDARTSDENIYAMGDCASRPLVHYDRRGRLESVHNAIEQGKLAAASILGKPRPPEDCPWFWSDQYDLKLQIAGLSAGHDEIVLRGAPSERKFAVFYLQEGKLIGVDAVNSPPEFLMSKKLIIAGARPDPAKLADASVSMKDIAVNN